MENLKDNMEKLSFMQNIKDDLSIVIAVSDSKEKETACQQHDTIEDLEQRINELEKKLLRAKAQVQQNDNMLFRLQLSQKLFEMLEKEAHPDKASTLKSDKSLINSFEEYRHLVSEVLEENDQISNILPKLDNLKRECLDVSHENRMLMSQLDQKKTDRKKCLQEIETEHMQMLKSNLYVNNKKTLLLKNTFQTLILASGINWAANKEMNDLVISLGTPVEVD